jgi:transketolase
MRKHFSNYIEQIAVANDDIVFITGDLGYNALENLAAKLGDRFINAGVAEQNMIGIAAGMASRGFRVICYSIAPFVVYRCLEQIRNDVCFHNLPVFIVGNGGGYGYGIMGSSHHCIEDIACLSGLPNMTCYVPAFLEDMNACLEDMFARRGPAYFRMGVGKSLPSYLTLTSFGAAQQPSANPGVTIIAQSPVANNIVAALSNNTAADRAELFIVNRMPLTTLPSEISESILRTQNVLTIEEHIAIGGLGSAVALHASQMGLPINKFISLHAEGYPDGLYGSQGYHQRISGLDEENINRTINSYF